MCRRLSRTIPRSAEVRGGGEAGNSAAGTIIELLFRSSASVWEGEAACGLNSATALESAPCARTAAEQRNNNSIIVPAAEFPGLPPPPSYFCRTRKDTTRNADYVYVSVCTGEYVHMSSPCASSHVLMGFA